MGTSDGELLAILFTDVEGSTELLSRQGDQLASEILRIHEELVRRQLGARRGREVSFRGDGFLATFPVLRDGLSCACEIQRALDAHNRSDPTRQVRVRIGIHCGAVTELSGQLYGQAVHAAARIMAEAAGGEILVSAAMAEACQDCDVPFVDRGLFWLKGFPDRWRLHEVVWKTPEQVAASAATRRARATPFVARDTERADLRQAVRSAIAGEGRLVFVGGEAGVGKTRLTEEVGAEAEARGMRVLVGHSVEMERGTPYLPFMEILESALLGPQSSTDIRDALIQDAPEIARLLPALRRELPDLPAPLDLPPEQARRYLWSSVEGLMRRAAQQRPLLLVLEDLHWADDSTLQLVQYLAGSLPSMPALIVATYRDSEIGASHPLARVLADLSRQRLVHRVLLQRVSEADVDVMVAGLAGQQPPAGLAAAIHGVTEGNPFFVEEVFLHLSESGALFDANGRFRRGLKVDEIQVPDSVRLVVGGRLARLSDRTRDALAAAAVSGREFAPEIVAAAAGLDSDELADAMDEAERARLVAASRSDPARLGFVHELIRQTLLADVSSLKRQRLHARTAAAIEAVYGERAEDHADELAYHLGRAGAGVDTRRLVRYLLLAGERALQAAAFDDGVAHFQRALTLVPTGDEMSRAELLERLAIARRSQGSWQDAFATMDQALELYQRLGESAAFGRLCWSMAYQLAWGARFEEAAALAQRGLAVLGELANPDRARLLSVTGWVVGLTGDYTGGNALFASARALAESLGDRRALADVLHMQTAHHMSYAEFQQGAATGLRAAAVFEEEGALWDLCSVLAFVGFELGAGLRLDEAAEVTARATQLADRLGHLGASFLCLADRATRKGLIAGDFTLCAQLGREQIDVCERASLPWVYAGHLFLGIAAQREGRRDDAERELRRAVELEPPGAFSGQSAMHLALLLVESGRAAEASTVVSGLKPRIKQPGTMTTLGGWNVLLGLTEALYLMDRLDEVAALRPLVMEAVAHGEWLSFDCRLVHTRAAIAAAAARDWTAAEQHFATAEELAVGLHHGMERADLRWLRARMATQRGEPGDRERARADLAEAAHLYRAMGLAARAEMVASQAPLVPAGAQIDPPSDERVVTSP